MIAAEICAVAVSLICVLITPAATSAAGVATAFPAVELTAAPSAGTFIFRSLYTKNPVIPVIRCHTHPA